MHSLLKILLLIGAIGYIAAKPVETPPKTVDDPAKAVETPAKDVKDGAKDEDKDKKIEESLKEDNKTLVTEIEDSLTFFGRRAVEQSVKVNEGNPPGVAPEPPVVGAPAPLPPPSVQAPPLPQPPAIPDKPIEAPPTPVPDVGVEPPVVPDRPVEEAPPTPAPDAGGNIIDEAKPEEAQHSSESIESEEVVAPPKAVGHSIIFQKQPSTEGKA